MEIQKKLGIICLVQFTFFFLVSIIGIISVVISPVPELTPIPGVLALLFVVFALTFLIRICQIDNNKTSTVPECRPLIYLNSQIALSVVCTLFLAVMGFFTTFLAFLSLSADCDPNGECTPFDVSMITLGLIPAIATFLCCLCTCVNIASVGIVTQPTSSDYSLAGF